MKRWYWPPVPSNRLLQQAIAALDAQNNRQARQLLDQILGREPKNSLALLYRGQAARNLGDDAAAARYWESIPDNHPREAATAKFSLGQQALAAYRARDAERLFRRATELQPQYLAPRVRLIALYNLQLRDAELRRELAAVRTERPWSLDELAYSTGYLGVALPWESQVTELRKFMAADPDDVNSILALAQCRLATEHVDEVIELLERSLARRPSDPSLRGMLADVLLQRKNPSRAQQILGAATQSDSPSVYLARAYGAVYGAADDWNEAAAWFEQAVLLDPDHQPTLFRLGQAQERAGRHEEAEGTLHRARMMEMVVGERARLLEVVAPNLWRSKSPDRESEPVHLDPDLVDYVKQIAVEIARLLVQLERAEEACAWLEQAQAWRPAEVEIKSRYAEAVSHAQSQRAASTARAVRPWINVATALPAPLAPPRIGKASSGGDLAPVSMVDRHAEVGVEFQYRNGASGSRFILETTGGGVAAFDFDGDGWPDLYFSQGCPLPVDPQDDPDWRDRLFQNVGGTFRDVTAASGLGDANFSQGTSAGDFDNDGFDDLVVANFGPNVLYRNNGDGTMTDVSTAAGLAGEFWHTSLAFADLNRDGNLDLYVVTYVRNPYLDCGRTCSPQNFPAELDRLFRSRGDGTFEDVSAEAGIQAEDGKGLGIIVADFDNDGWPDIYIANDTTPNFLFRNRAAGLGAPLRFDERGLASGAGVNGAGASLAGMGIACGDLDGDGLLDLFVTNFYLQSATFYRNQGDMLFADDTRLAGLDAPTRLFLGFGTQAVDVDLDGRLDLFIANGHVDDFRSKNEPWKMTPQLFYNLGVARFADASHDAGAYFQGEYLGRAVARLDWDRDGRPDLVVVHLDRPVALLRNETAQVGHRLILDLRGVESNRSAIGARISVTAGGSTRIHEICGGDGYLASNEKRVILGLGSPQTVECLEIRWPLGRQDRWFDIPVESELVLVEGRPPLIRKLP